MNREAICRNSSAAVVIALKKIHYPFQSIKSFDRFKNLLQGLTSIPENVIAKIPWMKGSKVEARVSR